MASSIALRTSSQYFPPLPSLRDFIHMHRLDLNRTLSQNFLMDMNLARKIVRKAGDMTDAHVLEVGPGPGGLTRAILEQPCKRLDVVEIGDYFMRALDILNSHSNGRMHIHRRDILKMDIAQVWTEAGARRSQWLEDQPPFQIIGNLPFNVSLPLIIKFMKQIATRQGPFAFGRVPLTFTLQSEVAKRIVAHMGSEDRSRIGVFCQNVADPNILFEVQGKCFTPMPKISVCAIQFVPRVEPRIATAHEVAEKVIRKLFSFKRRYLINGLRKLYPPELEYQMAHELLQHCGIGKDLLVGQLGMEELGAMCVYYEKQCREMPGLFLYESGKNARPMEWLAQQPNALPPEYKRQMEEMAQIDGRGMSMEEFGEAFEREQKRRRRRRRRTEGEEKGQKRESGGGGDQGQHQGTEATADKPGHCSPLPTKAG